MPRLRRNNREARTFCALNERYIAYASKHIKLIRLVREDERLAGAKIFRCANPASMSERVWINNGVAERAMCQFPDPPKYIPTLKQSMQRNMKRKPLLKETKEKEEARLIPVTGEGQYIPWTTTFVQDAEAPTYYGASEYSASADSNGHVPDRLDAHLRNFTAGAHMTGVEASVQIITRQFERRNAIAGLARERAVFLTSRDYMGVDDGMCEWLDLMLRSIWSHERTERLVGSMNDFHSPVHESWMDSYTFTPTGEWRRLGGNHQYGD